MYKLFAKRLCDIVLSLLLIILLSPVYLLIGLLVFCFLGNPIIFKQARSGKNNKVFYIWKFRTMTDKKDENGNLLPDEMREHIFGRILRSCSLDELPELFNILKGDMSFIGPRPLLPQYDEYFTEFESKRSEMRGGLIPPDSVTLKVVTTWDEQLQIEAEYSQKVSFLFDIWIVLCTFAIIYKRIRYGYGSFFRQPLNIERADMKEKETVNL